MRAAIVSVDLADPQQRGRLHALAALGVTVAAVTPERWIDADRQERRLQVGDDGPVRLAPVRTGGAPAEAPLARWNGRQLRRVLSDFRPDVIHLELPTWSPGAAAVAATARRLRLPLVAVGTTSIAPTLDLLARWRRDRVLALARALAAPNQAALRLLQAVRVGVPADSFPQAGIRPPTVLERPPRTGFTILVVGRLVPERGHATLFRACALLHGDWTLTVVGTGPEREPLERLAQSLGIAARLTWRDGLPERALADEWGRADVLVAPSADAPHWIDAFATPVRLAMAHGVPVVVSRAGALPELVDDAGAVVPPCDPEALAAALEPLLRDPAHRAAMGQAARRRALAAFVDEAVARRTLGLWKLVLASG